MRVDQERCSVKLYRDRRCQLAAGHSGPHYHEQHEWAGGNAIRWYDEVSDEKVNISKAKDLNLPWSYSIEDGAIRDNAHNVVIESVNPFIGEKIIVAMNTKALCDEIIACDKMSRDVADQLAKLAEEMRAGTVKEETLRKEGA